MLKQRNVLVTGGCGFVGRAVVELLRRNPALRSVTAFDNLDPLCGGVEQPGMARGDIRKLSELSNALAEHAVTDIVHLAAYGRNLTAQNYPLQAWNVNVTGTVNVLHAARNFPRIRRVLVCSSNICLSDVTTVYKITKQTCEELVRLYAAMGVSVLGLRPSNIYGPGQSTTEYQLCAMAALDQAFAKKGCFEITGDGEQSRDWVHVADVARAFEMALFSDVAGETLNVSTGRNTSMNEIARMADIPVEYIPARPGDAMRLVSDPLPARRKLGFTAELTLPENILDGFPCLTSKRLSKSPVG